METPSNPQILVVYLSGTWWMIDIARSRTIDVDSSEAEVLFEILDLSGDGSIDKEDREGQGAPWAKERPKESAQHESEVVWKLAKESTPMVTLWLDNYFQTMAHLSFMSVPQIIEMDMAQTPLPVQLGGIQVVWIAIL